MNENDELAVPQADPTPLDLALERMKEMARGHGRGFFFFRRDVKTLSDEDLELLVLNGYLKHTISYFDGEDDRWELDPEQDCEVDEEGKMTWWHEGCPVPEDRIGESWTTTDKLDDERPTPHEVACSCVHDRDVHCPETGACLYTNPRVGPCPCDATPEGTRKALWAAHEKLREALRGEAG